MVVGHLNQCETRLHCATGKSKFESPVRSTESRVHGGPYTVLWDSHNLCQSVKRLRREAEHSLPSSTEAKNAGSHTSTLFTHLRCVVQD